SDRDFRKELRLYGALRLFLLHHADRVHYLHQRVIRYVLFEQDRRVQLAGESLLHSLQELRQGVEVIALDAVRELLEETGSPIGDLDLGLAHQYFDLQCRRRWRLLVLRSRQIELEDHRAVEHRRHEQEGHEHREDVDHRNEVQGLAVATAQAAYQPRACLSRRIHGWMPLAGWKLK